MALANTTFLFPLLLVGNEQALVLSKLNDYGWADNDVLANFIVVMVANDKSMVDITAELNDILADQAPGFVEWLFSIIDGSDQEEQQQEQVLQQTYDISAVDTTAVEQDETIETTTTKQRTSPDGCAPGRLLQSAISSATRSESTGTATSSARQAPSRVYEDQKRERLVSRERSISPARSREGLTTSRGGNKEERIRFRRTSEERALDEAKIDARLGYGSGGRRDDGDRLRGRLGRIEDRLGKRDEHRVQSRERSWDRGSDYHDRRGGKKSRGNGENRRRDALRDIDRRLGTHPVENLSDNDMDSGLPRQPASWSRDPERMLRVEAEITKQAVDAEAAKITRCRYWPNCAQEDSCQFWHPRELCIDFPNCPKPADTCLYIHPLAEPTAEQVAAAARKALMQSMRNNVKNGTGSQGQEDEQSPALNVLQIPFALGLPPVQDCKFGARCTRSDWNHWPKRILPWTSQEQMAKRSTDYPRLVGSEINAHDLVVISLTLGMGLPLLRVSH
ncbi:hypothetical protein BGZ65_000769, partial [Modicella reniformis]